MVTREQYLEYRRVNNYPTTLLWEFYQEKCTGKCMSYEEFMKYVREGFPKVMGRSMFDNREIYAMLSFPIRKCMEKVVQYYDNKFQITEVKDKNNQLVAIL